MKNRMMAKTPTSKRWKRVDSPWLSKWKMSIEGIRAREVTE